MDTDTYLHYQLEGLSFFLGIKKTCMYVDLNRITVYLFGILYFSHLSHVQTISHNL